jgi:hypothetical protein
MEGYEVLLTSNDEEETTYQIKVVRGSVNELIQLASRVGEVHGFKELVPSMNDIFIQTVQNN